MGAIAPLEPGDPGQVGRYRIVGRLGRGGMGQVYLGRSPGGRAVAVKVVRDELAEDPAFRRRFVREVEAARQVTGLFTAAVVDADPEGNPPWLATEYVPGMSLAEAVTTHGAWPEESSVLALGAALAEALEAVHGADVVHRDLKPSNVLLAADGPRVIDFGISLAAEATKLTETGVVIGTPGFMPPEQLVDDKVSATGDVFAFGAVLAYTATGTGPFGRGSAHALNYRVVNEEPDLTGIPPRLADIVARCLAKDPDQRPTVPHLVEELSRLASQAGQDDRLSTAVGWLPQQVAAGITQAQATPLPAPPAEQTTVEAVPPTALATAPVPGPPPTQLLPPRPAPGDTRRVFTRRRVLAGSAITAVLTVTAVIAVIATSTSLPARKSGDSKATKLSAPALRQLWSTGRNPARPPVVKDGRAYFGDSDGAVYALDTDTGDRLWDYDDTTGSADTLTVAEGAVYFSSSEPFQAETARVYALDADTGDRLWEFKPKDEVYSGTVVAGGIAYFYSTTLTTEGVSSTLYAVDAETGDMVWSRVADESATTLAVHGGVVYYDASTRGNGADIERGSYLHALDAHTGKQLWKAQPGNDYLDRLTSLTVVRRVIYAVGRDTLYALDADNGGLLWKRRTSLSDFSDSGPPTVADGVVYVSGNNNDTQDEYGEVLAADAESGKVLWKYRMSPVSSPPTLMAGTVHVATESGDLHLLDADSGDSLGKVRLADDQEPEVTVADGVAYFDGGDGRLHAATITR